MKLRLRSQDSKETIRIEVSDQCTLENLKQTLLQTLGSSVPVDSLHLSLNRKKELQGSSSADSLRSLGITSGDLVFFTFNPPEFSSQEGTSIQSSSKVKGKQIKQFQSIDCDHKKLGLENFEPESMVEEVPIGVVEKNCSVSIFLRRVMNEGLGRNAHKLLVTAVHSVLSESGFVLIDRIDMSDGWRSTSFSMSLRYSLPKLYTMKEVVMLKFQSLGHFVIVYGYVSCIRGSNVYSVTLDEITFAPNLDSTMDENEGKNTERKVLEFWKVVKDSLALPLLIDLEKTSLPHPASLMLLPDDMKLTILEALPGVDIGKLQCVCTELRNLASSNDLWKMKFNQEFPLGEDSVSGNGLWKPKFVAYYRNKRLRSMLTSNIGQTPPHSYFLPVSFVYGGGYDVWHDFGAPANRQHFGPGRGQ